MPENERRPVGPSEARERAEQAALDGKFEESIAWSLLGLLTMKARR
jgi:hypothetical protein